MAITLNGKSYGFTGFVNRISTYLNRPTGPASGFSELTAAVTNGVPSTKTKSRVRWRCVVPVVADGESPQHVEGDIIRMGDFEILVRAEATASSAELDDLCERIESLVASPEFTASVKGLTPPAA